MNNFTISIFGNQNLLIILNELKVLSKFSFKNYQDINLCINESKENKQLVVFFKDASNNEEYLKIVKNNIPILVINDFKESEKDFSGELIMELVKPFKIMDFETKIISLLAKYEFNISSLINLGSYIIDKNERKIKKNNLELQLTEKEIDFLVLFSKNKKPLDRNFVLNKVWNYSSEADTHTIETHIHRLRKKILQKFNDNNFIKNNSKGYYI